MHGIALSLSLLAHTYSWHGRAACALAVRSTLVSLYSYFCAMPWNAQPVFTGMLWEDIQMIDEECT